MPCLSKVIRRVNKAGRVVGLALRCEGTCGSGQPCRTHDRGDPENLGQILRFCACPEDIPIPQPDPTTRQNIVRGCRVALRLQRTLQGQLKPADYCCVGACEDTEHTECAAVIHETIPLADGGRQEIIVCRCIDRVESLALARTKPTVVAAKGAAAKKRRRGRG